MPKLKRLSGRDVISIISSFGFSVHDQNGSHVKLVRITPHGKEVLVIPNHKEIHTGTLKAIFNQVSRFIPQDELSKEFYTE